MKKYWIIALAAVAAMASCTRELEETAPVTEATGSTLVITAGFEDTSSRTSLSMNGDNTHAEVVWNSGDAIRVLASAGEYSYYSSSFTTSSDGVPVGEFACHNWQPVSSTMYGAIYPSDKLKGFSYNSTSGYTFGLVIPPVQTAVKGGVERGLLRAFAKIGSSMAPDIKFKNGISLLRFRIAGSAASQVRKVKLTASATISGDCMIYLRENGDIEYDVHRWFLPLEYGQQNYIELSGSFESGADYYFASIPCESEGFSLLFYNASGQVIACYSDKTLNLRRSRITDIGTVTLNTTFGTPNPNVIKYMEHTKGSKPVTIALVAEGFTASEQDKFVNLAGSAVDLLFQTEPYKTYKDYFNVYLMKAVSKESGASVTNGSGTVTTRKDTFFSARWGSSSYDDMTSDCDKAWGYVSTFCPEIQSGLLSIDEVAVAMIINDTRYGGRCHVTSTGRCMAHVPYTYGGKAINWSFPSIVADDDATQSGAHYTTTDEYNELGRSKGDWRNTLMHEFGGHGFGRLLDEYWKGTSYSTGTTISGHGWSLPYGLNISGTYNNVPWQDDLLSNQSSLIAKDSRYSRLGRFQGGDEMIMNRWRCEKISCMIDNRPYYSAWQRELIVKRIMELAGGSFSLSDFISKDVTTDPVRDGASTKAPLPDGIECPPLAPPVLIDRSGHGVPQPECLQL